MKVLLAFSILALSVFLIISSVYAQIIISSGSTTFSTATIVYHPLQFSGDLNFLRIYWNSSYLTGVATQIGVKCYLNCNPLSDSQKCAGQQNCTFRGPPGEGVCTIQSVSYSYPLDSKQNATCIFYNPDQPDLEYKKIDGTYPNSTFYPILFNLYLAPNFTVAVGKEISMSMIVQNLGVFTDNYTQTVSAYPGNLIALNAKTQNATFGPLVGNSFGNSPQSFVSLAKFIILSTTSPINVIVDMNSTTNSTVYQEQVVQIRAGVSSLPDFGWIGILQIILLSSLVLFFMRKRL